MSDRRERIPASEITEPKRWELPYWTDPPHEVRAQMEREEKERATAAGEVLEEDEIEIEPLTAEQLEEIRQEAYDAGLEEGLKEGREKGEKEGHQEGHKKGLDEGQAEGRKLGFDAGTEKGESQAKQKGESEIAQTNEKLNSVINELSEQLKQNKKMLEAALPDLVIALAQAVVAAELKQGSEHIVDLVRQAMDALPMESGQVKIQLNPQDMSYIEAAFKDTDLAGSLESKETIEAGGCHIHSRYSAVDFTLQTRWQSILKQYNKQLLLGLNATENEPDIIPVDASEAATTAPKIEPAADIEQAAGTEPSAETKEAAEPDQAVNTEQSTDPEQAAEIEQAVNTEQSAEPEQATNTDPETDVSNHQEPSP